MQYYELENYEADDINSTLATKADKTKFDVVILTGDRDLTQLATEEITVAITLKGVTEIEKYTPEHIAEKYNGLKPMQIVDMKGLAGDASDNIPGVTKIGEKTAIKLLNEYESVEGIYEHIDEMKKSKMKEHLIEEKEIAFLSKKLATINTKAPVDVEIDSLSYEGKDLDKLVPFYKEMNFQSFLDKLDIKEETVEMEDILFEVVEETTKEMFTTDSALYIEMLGENYHVEDIVGIAWGTPEKIYVSDSLAVLEQSPFQNWLFDKNKKKRVFDVKALQVALNRYVG